MIGAWRGSSFIVLLLTLFVHSDSVGAFLARLKDKNKRKNKRQIQFLFEKRLRIMQFKMTPQSGLGGV